MLSINHPRPARSGKPVAALAQRQSDDVPDIAYAADVPERFVVPPAPATSPLCELHFYVRYTLGEYVSFMWQHAGFLIRRRRVRWPANLYLRIKSTAGAALHFVLLGRGRRTYEFTIDRHGIVRTSGGVTLIDWSDVSAVRTYSRGFMMVLKRGTLPIPFRCLSDGQLAAMRSLADTRRENALR